MAHYESMEPCSNTDTIASIKLVKDYQEGRYQYSSKDLPFLFGLKEQENCIKRKHEDKQQADYISHDDQMKIDENKKKKKTIALTNQ